MLPFLMISCYGFSSAIMKENHKTQILPSPQVMPISSGYSNHRSPLVMPILKTRRDLQFEFDFTVF
uniref:Uncharacterized protein n=1 Tax=Helianthus annuus TaxID=4232 RepID=A0A251UKY9_HELAN